MSERSEGGLVAGDDTPFFRRKRELFVSRFLHSMPVEGKRVLEIGCGAAANLIELARAAPEQLVGCDISREMVDLARAATRGLHGVEIVELREDGLPFPPRSFDIAFTVTVLHHNHDTMLPELIAEACRVTGERLYLFEDTAPRKRARYSYVLRPVREYEALCQQHGLRLVESRPLGLYSSWLVSAVLRATLNPLRRAEGEPVGRLHRVLEQMLLPATAALDRVIPQRRGLTKMEFVRE
jgi:SAM-dependent methyltransferase